jgi:hypothetical protein
MSRPQPLRTNQIHIQIMSSSSYGCLLLLLRLEAMSLGPPLDGPLTSRTTICRSALPQLRSSYAGPPPPPPSLNPLTFSSSAIMHPPALSFFLAGVRPSHRPFLFVCGYFQEKKKATKIRCRRMNQQRGS